ncbi:flagellar motor protein MotB [Gimesia aquarii]|uniref:Motility protein B n=1 Tax=Gimesia aquarii TaxID=2527964 RepID=A0A517WW80_9PLAN|nr:flagellar motor protein MotB [Gimesia aquarii]QDU09514.1 Motility protein B [Gimesia aquarii]
MAMPEDDGPPGVPEWVVTYGDMMSLLLTFFIMLVSMSEIRTDEGSVRAMLDSLRERFGSDPGTAAVPGKNLEPTSNQKKPASKGSSSDGGTKAGKEKSAGGGGPNKTVERINSGTEVTLGGGASFGRFSAELNPEIKRKLDIIAEILAPRPNRLVVRGHASPEPLPKDSKFRDSQELSFYRAKNVAEYLESKGIAPERLIVSSSGDAEPQTITRNPEEQYLNRRVDVFLIDEYTVSPKTGNR